MHPIRSKTLSAKYSASAYDERYEMASVYCVDATANYCFSLTRFPGNEEIALMVHDQLLTKVLDLRLTLRGNVLTAHVDHQVAADLDGFDEYVIRLEGSDANRAQLIEALQKIFEGKNGLTLSA